METSTKTRNIFTGIIFIIVLIFAYAMAKSFFVERSNSGNRVTNKSGFYFVYDKNILTDKFLKESYDGSRSNRLAMEMNYDKATKDYNKGKLFLEPSNIEYVFSNMSDNPKYYKLSIKKQEYLTLYNMNESNGTMYFVVLGSDLKYYKISVSINKNTEEMNTEDKSWKEYGTKDYSIYPNIYYKVIDEVCNIGIELPTVFDEAKYMKDDYEELRDKIEKAISIEQIDSFEYTYYKFDLNDIKINKNITLLLKDSKVYQYYSKNDTNSNLSYTTLTYIKPGDKFVSFTDIDDKESYNSFVTINGIKEKEYEYNGVKLNLLYRDADIKSGGITYQAISFVEDNHYYVVSLVSQVDAISDENINTFITNAIDGILVIK